MARNRRSSSQGFLLFNPHTTLGWSVARRIGVERGLMMEDAGTAIRVNDALGNHIGWQLKSDNEPKKIAMSVQTAICITAGELMAAVGLMGRSLTSGMTEEMRLSRIHPMTRKALPAEDFVERSQAKLKLYPFIHDTKAPLGVLVARTA